MLEVIRDAGDNLASVQIQPSANALSLISGANAPIRAAIPQQMQIRDSRASHMNTRVYHFARYLKFTLFFPI